MAKPVQAIGNVATGRCVKDERELLDLPRGRTFRDLGETQLRRRAGGRAHVERRTEELTKELSGCVLHGQWTRDRMGIERSRLHEFFERPSVYTGAQKRQATHFEKAGTRNGHDDPLLGRRATAEDKCLGGT